MQAGVTGAVPYYNGTSWVTTATNVYDDGSNIGIGNTAPNASAILDLTNTTHNLGFLPPVMNATNEALLAPSQNGLIVFNSTTNCLDIYINKWQSIYCPCPSLILGSITGSATPCPSTSTSYSILPVTGATNYSWASSTNATITTSPSSGPSVTSVSVTTPASGTYTLTVTATNSCSTAATATISATVTSSAPSAPAFTAKPTPVCANSTNVYTISSVAGLTYSWSVTGTGAGIVGSTTGTSASVTCTTNNYVVSVTASNSCSVTASSSVTVTVVPLHGTYTWAVGTTDTLNLSTCITNVSFTVTGGSGGQAYNGGLTGTPGYGDKITGTIAISGGVGGGFIGYVGSQGGNASSGTGGTAGNNSATFGNNMEGAAGQGESGGSGGGGGAASILTTITTGYFFVIAGGGGGAGIDGECGGTSPYAYNGGNAGTGYSTTTTIAAASAGGGCTGSGCSGNGSTGGNGGTGGSSPSGGLGGSSKSSSGGCAGSGSVETTTSSGDGGAASYDYKSGTYYGGGGGGGGIAGGGGGASGGGGGGASGVFTSITDGATYTTTVSSSANVTSAGPGTIVLSW